MTPDQPLGQPSGQNQLPDGTYPSESPPEPIVLEAAQQDVASIPRVILVFPNETITPSILCPPVGVDEPPKPIRPPHPGFWGAFHWCVAFLVVSQVIPVFIIAAVAIALFFIREPDAARMGQQDVAARLTSAIMTPSIIAAQVLGFVFVLCVIRFVLGRDWRRILALRRPSVPQTILVLLGMPAFVILPGGIAYLCRQAGMPTFDYQKSLEGMFTEWPVWAGVLLFGVAPGLTEELFCRGFLGRGLVGRYGAVVGVILTSFLFGLMHIDPPHVVATACMGAALHFVYLTTRSLWLPMLIHFLNNSLGVVGAILDKEYPELKELDEATSGHLVPFMLGSAILLAAVGWALYRCRTRFVSTEPGAPPWSPPYAGIEHRVIGLGMSVRPRYVGVEYPPSDNNTKPARPWPGWWATLGVLCGLLVFAAAIRWAPALSAVFRKQGQEPESSLGRQEVYCDRGLSELDRQGYRRT